MIQGVLLAAALAAASPTADLRYFQNAGWMVTTPRHVLVFDYVPSMSSADGAESLGDGATLSLDDVGHRRVVVFVTHSHGDHFSPIVFEWAKKSPKIEYVLGTPLPSGPPPAGARLLPPRQTWTSDGLTVETTGSTDEGVGFFVRVDGLSLYHAGDHALWDASIAPAFEAEIAWLAGRAKDLDLAFFPIATGFDCEPRADIAKGVRSAAATLKPRVLVPMHVRCGKRLGLYEAFAKETKLEGTSVIAPSAVGVRFRYESGTLSPR